MSYRPPMAFNQDLVKFDEDRKIVFLEHLAEHGRMIAAAKHADISISTVHGHMEELEGFNGAVALARQTFLDRAEGELNRRVFEGIDRPIFQKGELVGHETQFSDRLLELMLRANNPDKYKNNIDVNAKIKHGGVLVVAAAPTSAEDWEKQYGDKEPKVIDSVGSPTGEPTSVPE